MAMTHVTKEGSLAILVVCAAAAACGPTVSTFGSGGGSGGGASTTTTTTTTMSSSSSGGGDECAGFDDQASEHTVSLRIRNKSKQDIFIPTVCGVPQFQIDDGTDGPVQYRYDNYCLSTCEDLQSQGPIVCTAEACAATVVRIGAGQDGTITWDGTGLMQRTMPAACWHEQQGSEGCQQIVAAQPGKYAFTVAAYSECVGQCECDADECQGEAGGAEGKHVPVALEFPKDDKVDIVFDECTFGCPEKDN